MKIKIWIKLQSEVSNVYFKIIWITIKCSIIFFKWQMTKWENAKLIIEDPNLQDAILIGQSLPLKCIVTELDAIFCWIIPNLIKKAFFQI